MLAELILGGSRRLRVRTGATWSPAKLIVLALSLAIRFRSHASVAETADALGLGPYDGGIRLFRCVSRNPV